MEVPFGTGAGHEIPEVQAVAGPSETGNLVVLFYANGLFPVAAQLAFSGEVLPDPGRFGSQLLTKVPLVAIVPGGPDVSVVSVQTTIGPNHLTYYRRVHGRLQAFRPGASRSRTMPAPAAFRSPRASPSKTEALPRPIPWSPARDAATRKPR